MKIAYITERKLDSKYVSGAITRDIRLLDIINSFAEVDIYFNDTTKYHKYLYVVNNTKINRQLFSEIYNNNYDLVIISTFTISPFLNGYRQIKSRKIFYFADSSYHFRSQKQSLKSKLISYMLSFKERNILKDNYCAYLGDDEVRHIPEKYHDNCLKFPFFIKTNENLFNNNGKLIMVGNYSFQPNLIMLKNINNIAEHIKDDIYIYGYNIPNLNYKSNIKIIGYTDTLEEIYHDARALIYCIDYGTGIKNKVLEAMSYGIPTIGYKEAFTNLELTNKKNSIICQNMNDIIVATNIKSLEDISNNVHHFVQFHFSFDSVKKTIEKSIKRIINDQKSI